MEQGAGNVNAILTGVSTIASSVIVQSSQEEPSNIALTGSYSESRRSLSAAPSATPSPVLSPPGKIFGKNSNGTMIATSTPSNEAELQLYRVLQKASLLAYYDTLLEMGGDDVQQLCDAGEDEFLEIMALVGMASKPLHVRRLQKALHEWMNNPSAFQTPLPTIDPIHLMYSPEPTTSRPKQDPSPTFNPTPLMSTAHSNSSVLLPLSAGVSSQVSSSCSQLTPGLTEAQISTLAVGAEILARQITQREPKAQNSKKRTSRELEQVMAMSDSDPRRMDEIRKFAAIYGRFDCKRKPEKPLTLHEICVNEAAAQICKFVPALLTRRDELFPFARQLVKDAGFGHSSSTARFGPGQHPMSPKIYDSENIGSTKRTRLIANDSNPADYTKDIVEESRTSFLAIYQKLGRSFNVSDIAKFSLCRSDYEDNDSRHSFSQSDYEDNSLPLGTLMNGPEAEAISHDYCGTTEVISRKGSPRRVDDLQTSPLGVKVISASGSHIIAVANPALALSSSVNDSLSVKREKTSPSI